MKAKVAELRKMIEEMYDGPFIPTRIIMKVEPKVVVENI